MTLDWKQKVQVMLQAVIDVGRTSIAATVGTQNGTTFYAVITESDTGDITKARTIPLGEFPSEATAKTACRKHVEQLVENLIS